MGIKCRENIVVKTQDEFHAIDKVVTGFAFDIQNSMGKFCDEKIYQEVLAIKCKEASMSVQREVEIIVAYEDFRKTYKLDLLLNNGVIYELKAVKALNNIHKQQLINYLLLTGLKYGKLLNFHSSSVEYKYVSTSLTKTDRYNISVDSKLFLSSTDKCTVLKNILENLLNEWGAYLDYKLYNEALTHFLGGCQTVIQTVDITFNKKVVGRQKMHLLDNETVFHVSSINKAAESYENNIIRLIKHTNINTVQWINFNKNNIILKTIKKK